MENFEFWNPVRIIFGPGEVTRTGTEAARLGGKALLVSYEEHAIFADLLAHIQEMLASQGVGVVPFFEVTANPTTTQVARGIDLARREKADLVIGVGGGSAMDAAKIIAAGVLYKGDPWNMVVSRHDKVTAVFPTEALPLVMVATLPATSSEMNCGAVVTNDRTLEKSYVFADCLFPRVSILDPVLTCSLPPYQTACGGADAISHALESYLNSDGDTPVQDRMMEGVILTTMEYVGKALADPNDVTVRAHLQWAAAVAWNGWAQCGIGGWAPMHQLGHVLSARHDVTHGASLAVVMPAWMKHLHRRRLDRYVQMAERVFGVRVKGGDREAAALEGIERFEAFLKGIVVPTRLSDVGVGADEIDAMTDDVVRISFSDDGTLCNRPALRREDVRAIYELAR